MVYVIVKKDHITISIERFDLEQDALNFIEKVEKDLRMRCELVYEKD